MPNAPDEVRSAYRHLVLAVLICAYTLNFLDRQILAILAGAVKRDLQLSDSQLGLMGGLAFALFYTGLGVPTAWLADRWSRSWIMTGSLALWSAFTAACGFAGGFASLFLCRIGVGVGEAGGVAPAYSLICDDFPKAQRARALAAYSFGIPTGMALGILSGGLIAHALNWRVAFVAVGLAGVLLAPVFRLVVREPPRREAIAAPTLAPIRTLLAKPVFWLISLGSACSSVCGYGIAFWLPSYFERSLGMSLVHRAEFLAAMTLAGGVAGIWAGGWLGDRLGRRSPAAYMLTPAAAFVVALPCFFLAMTSKNLVIAFLLFLLPTGLNLVWIAPVITAVQHLAPAQSRSTASACFLFVNNLIGLGLGAWYFGAVSDALAPRFGAAALKYAIYSGLSFYLIAAALLALAAGQIRRAWIE